jgi:hypothetical protein
MTRHIGGFSLEGRYFIVQVPEGWKETDSLPDPSPEDLWFDRVSEFKAALHGPWIRKPVRRSAWKESPLVAALPPIDQASIDQAPTVEELHRRLPLFSASARSRSLGDLMESDGSRREIAARFGQLLDT